MRLILITLGLILAVAGPSGAAETQIAILTATPSGAWYPLGNDAFEHLYQSHTRRECHGAGDARLGREFTAA